MDKVPNELHKKKKRRKKNVFDLRKFEVYIMYGKINIVIYYLNETKMKLILQLSGKKSKINTYVIKLCSMRLR